VRAHGREPRLSYQMLDVTPFGIAFLKVCGSGLVEERAA
jgi:hypothetical protein